MNKYKVRIGVDEFRDGNSVEENIFDNIENAWSYIEQVLGTHFQSKGSYMPSGRFYWHDSTIEILEYRGIGR